MPRAVTQMASSRGPVRTRARWQWTVAAVLTLSAAVTGCAREQSAAAAGAQGGEIPEVLATIGDERITLADLRPEIGSDLDNIEGQYQRARSKLIETALERHVRERLLQGEAQRQGKTVDELVAAEAGPGGLEPTEVEIAAWYSENQARLGGRTLDQVRSQIADFLREERRREATQRLEQRLNQERTVAVNFQPFRLTLDNTGAPALGGADAPVTVVEFSDFQCPFCQRFAPVLKQLAQNFGDSVHVVYRQFPIPSIHPNAFKAAEASLCANEEGKFWELHDIMFAEQNRLTIPDLKEKARRVGIDQRKFDSCLDSGRYTEQIQRDMAEGQRAGVTGTPAVFVNGVPLQGGAVPYSEVAQAVRRELDRRPSR